MQVAMYLDGVAALQHDLILPMPPDDEPNRFLIVASEKRPPHLANCFDVYDFECDEPYYDWLDLGRRDYRPLLESYRVCRESGVWPGHGDETKSMALPDYAIHQLTEIRKLDLRV